MDINLIHSIFNIGLELSIYFLILPLTLGLALSTAISIFLRIIKL